jgi:general secretion pathway protein G
MTPHSFPSTQARWQRTRDAFTLLEILVVLAIIGLLVSLAVSNIDKIFGDAKASTAELFVKESMKIPLTTYRINMGDFPSTAEGLQALVSPPSGKADRWKGPYLQDGKLPKDPWGRDYQYRYPGTHNKTSYDLYSFGPEGQENDKVIGNW